MCRAIILILQLTLCCLAFAGGYQEECYNTSGVVRSSWSGASSHHHDNRSCLSAGSEHRLPDGRTGVASKVPDAVSYDSMPELFQLDNYKRCLAPPGGAYCILDLDLANVPGQLYDYIMEYSAETTKHYYYARLHRGVCVSARCGLNATAARSGSALLSCLNQTVYKESGVQVGQVKIRYCESAGNEPPPPDALDNTVAVVVALLLLLSLYGTVHHLLLENGYISAGNPYAMAFSIPRNWQILKSGSVSGDEESNVLRSLQGMRFLTMLIIIGAHAFLIQAHGYVSNPDFIEGMYNHPVQQMLLNGRVVVQTFFVMSGFLLCHQFTKDLFPLPFTLRYLHSSVLNRYVRLLPAVMLTVGLTATWVPRVGSGPLWPMLVNDEKEICRSGWWRQVLFIQNLFGFNKVCLPQTWYLAADTQLYVLGLLFMTVLWRYQKHGRLLFTSMLAISLAVSALQTYFKNMQPIRVVMFPEAFMNLFLDNQTFVKGYMSAQANCTGYLLGMLTAYVYHLAQRNKWDLHNSAVLKWAFYASLPVATCAIKFGSEFHSRPATRLESAAFNALDHNVFAAAMCVFILGCIYKCDRVLRSCVEWAPLQPLGRLSFSALLLHTPVLRIYIGQQTNLMFINFYSCFYVLMGAVVITFMLSVLMFLLVEQPACQLQKIRLGISKPVYASNKSIHTSAFEKEDKNI